MGPPREACLSVALNRHEWCCHRHVESSYLSAKGFKSSHFANRFIQIIVQFIGQCNNKRCHQELR